MKKVIFTLFLVGLLFNCQKKDVFIEKESESIKGTELKVSLDDLQEKATILGVLLEDVYKNEDAIELMNIAISSEYYTDERVLLKDLLKPDESLLFKNLKRARNNLVLYSFKNDFEKALLKYSKNLRMSSGDIEKYFIDNGVGIYFPYSQNFSNKKIENITLVIPSTKNADEGPGSLFDGKGGKKKVIVNDEYAKINPTHIIVAEAEVAKVKSQTKNRFQGINAVDRVYIGDITTRTQYDQLIGFTNTGGSEIYILRISGYLSVVGGQITTPAGPQIRVDVTRSQCGNAKGVLSLWDTDWVVGNTNQVLAVFEDDNANQNTITGSLATTLKPTATSLATVAGNSSFSLVYKSEDAIIVQQTWSRASFFASNGVSAGWGTLASYGSVGIPGTFASYGGKIGYAANNGGGFAYNMPTQLIP